ncbi:hypothetical protein O181_010933 [Austropuccinia psidii MF-1]|uniref:Uncharacterized protein n=1 Tax=Austropuccinia psidii MF-1 TaxID=1389203 RepID=A0A9Q3GKV0_9BASI|nr:hypothetical protein [Austropuccinia psidii MF-1]
MRPKVAKGATHQTPRPGGSETTNGPTFASSGPKNQPTQKWPKHLSTQNWPRTTSGQNLAHGLWNPPEATISPPSKSSPQVQGKTFPSSMHPALKDPGVVHIGYNIPLCTIFAQHSNSDVFRTKLCDSKPSPQSITNFKGGFFSYSVWKFPGDYQKTI